MFPRKLAERFRGSGLFEFSLIQQHNPIGALNYSGTMADHNRSFALTVSPQRIQHFCFRHWVKGTRGLVQN
jgi:hypothetical protein